MATISSDAASKSAGGEREDPESVKKAAVAAATSGNWERAVALWQECLSCVPEAQQWPWWWSSLGEAQTNLGRFHDAAATYATIRQRWPEEMSGWRGGAFIAARQGLWAQSAALWRSCMSCVTEAQQLAWWWSSLGEAEWRAGSAERAAAAYAEMRRRWPDELAGWRGGAHAAMKLKNYEEALGLWQGSLLRAPDAKVKGSLQLPLADALLKLGRADEAIEALRAYCVDWPAEPSGWRALVAAMAERNGWPAAVRAWRILGGATSEAMPGLARDIPIWLLRAGEYAAAEAQVDALKRKSPDASAWLPTYLHVLRGRGDHRGAFALLSMHVTADLIGGALSAGDAAKLAFEAGLTPAEAEKSLSAWCGKAQAEAAVFAAYNQFLLHKSNALPKWTATTISSHRVWHKQARAKLRGFLRERTYAHFMEFAELAIRRASPAQLFKLVSVALSRFPRARGTLQLQSLSARMAIPASDVDEAFSSRWRNILPRPEQSIAAQLNGRARRRLVCVLMVRDEDELLKQFLRHYIRLGVVSFIILDNGSANDPAGILAGFRDVEISLVRAPGAFDSARHGMVWVNEILELDLCDWLLFADVDEFLVYPGHELFPLPRLVEHLDRRGETAMFAPMIDAYDEGFATGALPSGEISRHRYFDASLVSEATLRVPWARVEGGVRSGLAYNLSKVPLVKAAAGIRYTGNHNITAARISATQGALIHYKLLRDRQLLSLSDAEISSHSRVRDRAGSCISRHLAAARASRADQPERPFQLRLTIRNLLRVGYLAADGEWRAMMPRSLPEEVARHAAPPHDRLVAILYPGERMAIAEMPVRSMLTVLRHAAAHCTRVELRLLMRAYISRLQRREVALSALLVAALASGRPAAGERILRRLRACASGATGPLCASVLIAAASLLKKHAEAAWAVLEIATAVDAPDRQALVSLSDLYFRAGRLQSIVKLWEGRQPRLHERSLFQYLRALRNLRKWDEYVTELASAVAQNAAPSTELLLLINSYPLRERRAEFLGRLMKRTDSEWETYGSAGLTVHLALLYLHCRRADCAALFSECGDRLPGAAAEFFRRALQKREGLGTFNSVWAVGLSKTGTTSLHDFCRGHGLLSAHFLNPVLGTLLTAEDAEIFDVVSDTTIAALAREKGVPEGRKIILTKRDQAAWARSFLAHFQKVLNAPDATFEGMKALLETRPLLPFGDKWRDIHHELYFRFRTLEEAYGWHEQWAGGLSTASRALLALPVEMPDDEKAERLGRFLGLATGDVAYPRSNVRLLLQ